MAVKTKAGAVEKTNFGKKKAGKSIRHLNKHSKTKASNQAYRGQGR